MNKGTNFKVTIHKNGKFFGEMESDCFIIVSKKCGGVLLGDRAPELEDIRLAAGAVNVMSSILEVVELETGLPKEIIETYLSTEVDKLDTVLCEDFMDAVRRADNDEKAVRNG